MVSRSDNGGLDWQSFPLDSDMASEPRTLSVDPMNPNVVYLGDNGGGVLKTADGGQHWVPVNIGLNGIVVYDVVVDDDDTRHMLIGTSGGVYERINDTWHHRLSSVTNSVQFVPGASNAYVAGLFGDLARTADSGATWSISTGVANGRILDIAIDPTNTRTMFIADESHVRRSTDGGDTFSPVLEGVSLSGENYNMNTLAFDPSNASHIYAGGGNYTRPRTEGEIWESKDGGDTWQRTGLTDVIVNKVAVDPRYPNIVYAGCGYSGACVHSPIFKSTDAGATWNPAETGMPNEHITLREVWADSENNAYAAGGTQDQNGHILHFNGSEVKILYAGGVQQDTYYQDTFLEGIFGVDAAHIYAVGENGLILQKEGDAWRPMPSNTSSRLYSIWGTAPSDLFTVGEAGTILHFDGTVWADMVSGTSIDLVKVFGTASDNVYVVGEAGTILHYDGNAWSPAASPTDSYLKALWAAAPNAVFAGGADGTIVFYDGSTWSVMTTGKLGIIEGLWGSSADDVYAAGEDKGSVLHYDGTAWTPWTTIPDAAGPDGIWGVPGKAVFVTDWQGGLFRHNGSQWETLRATGNRLRAVTDLAFNRLDPDIVYASTTHAGVYVTPNQAGQWLNLGTPDGNVFAISSGSLYAGTNSGLYQLTGTGIIAGDVSAAATGTMVHGADVHNDLGARCISVHGAYMMVSPAGSCAVTATADGLPTTTVADVVVFGSDVTRVDIEMGSGSGELGSNRESTDNVSNTASGGSYCFIGTAGGGIGQP